MLYIFMSSLVCEFHSEENLLDSINPLPLANLVAEIEFRLHMVVQPPPYYF